MYFILLVMILSTALSGNCIELNQPTLMVVKPKESFSISCKITGYSASGGGCTNWIRQSTGKEMEWIGWFCSSDSTGTSNTMKNKISFTVESSSNTVFLRGQNFQTEDTAVYYCARRYDAAFDYWGKGTTVTVTSAQPSAPKSIFALSQCNADSDGFLTVGCMTRGFSPADSLTFKWKAPGDKELNSFVQYPAFGSDGAYTKISHLRVKKSDWNPETHYTCEASNSIGRLEVIFGPPAPPPELPATVYLTVPTKKELDNGTATFICLAQQFSPKAYKFKWFQDGQEVTKPTGDIDTYDTSEKKGSVTEYSATSIFKISADTWMNTDTTVKCVFEHKAGNKEREAKYTAPDCSNIDVVIDPPSLEDMLKNRKGMLMCKAKGESQGFTKIEIKANNYVIAEASEESFTGKTTATLKALIGYEEWSNGTEFSCTVEHTDLPQPKQTTFTRENGKEHKRPSVYLLAPPEHKKGETMTLTCYVKDFYPKEVFVSWLADDEPVNLKSKTSPPMETDKYFSVYSQITVLSDKWKSGSVYSCVVYHETIDERMRVLTRSIADNTDKPAVINLSMNTPACCKE